MTPWETVRLGEAVELAYGKSLPKNARADGPVPVYGSNGIAGWHDTALVNEPTVIVGRKGSAGAVQYVEQPCHPIDTTYFVRVRENFSFEIKFLYYLFRKLDLSRLKTATGVPGLTREDAYKEQIPVPPLAEQRRIVDILSRAEGIIRLQRQAAEKTREIIPALFLNMFGDPARNPKGWPVATIGDVIEAAEYGTSKKASDDGSGIALIRMGNVTYDGALDLTEIKHVELSDDERLKYMLADGDILFNRTNSKDLVGKTGLWAGQFEAVAASYFIRVRPNRAAVLPCYLWAFLNTAHMKRRLFAVARGAIGQSNINAQELRAFSIAIPPTRLQHEFADRVNDVRGILAQRDMSYRSGDGLFQVLLAQSFSE